MYFAKAARYVLGTIRGKSVMKDISFSSFRKTTS